MHAARHGAHTSGRIRPPSSPARSRRWPAPQCRRRCGTRRTARSHVCWTRSAAASARTAQAAQEADERPALRHEHRRMSAMDSSVALLPHAVRRRPPTSVGMARKKEKSVAALRDRPSSMPPMMVAPRAAGAGDHAQALHQADLERVQRRSCRPHASARTGHRLGALLGPQDDETRRR